ncbi:hypothetical protein ACIBEA_39320 [Streptomyces sp. NPDC051555]|uniref:hypothetical protein n=1 Tax=Streptomyces sp. NPDC051555 TaxID=3365657 RepID=UPI0037A45362
MNTLLIGRLSRSTLTITESHSVTDDQDAIDALTGPAFADGADWAVVFDVTHHRDAVQRAYEEYAQPDGAVVEDEVWDVQPVTF